MLGKAGLVEMLFLVVGAPGRSWCIINEVLTLTCLLPYIMILIIFPFVYVPPIRHLGKESPAISTVFYPGPLASDPASESVSVDAPAKKADSFYYYYGITFYSYP